MKTSKLTTFISIAAASALISFTAQAADNTATPDWGYLLLEHKDHGSCRYPLRASYIKRGDVHANLPGCPFRAPTSIRFVNAPSAVTVIFRTFEHINNTGARDDCHSNLTYYPYRLTIKTTGAIAGTGQAFNFGDMLQAPINGAVAPNVRLVSKSTTANNSPRPEEYLACLVIDPGDQ